MTIRRYISLMLFICLFGLLFTGHSSAQTNKNRRSLVGLQVLYNFPSGSNSIIKDRAGVGEPIDLQVNNPGSVRRGEGVLEIRGKTTIQSQKPATRLFDAIRKSNELTLEVWLQPANTRQNGPARIVTMSRNPNERNFTLGQEGNRYDVRLRTTKTTTNGMPSLSSPGNSLTTKRTHVVYTRSSNGQVRFYIDGKRRADKKITGTMKNWNNGYRLALANELSGDRPWQGKLFLVAIYTRALSGQEVEQNFRAGADAYAEQIQLAKRKNSQLFKDHIIPIFAKHCLECHGWRSKRGRLDLSRHSTAFVSEGRRIIAPGNSASSLLWKEVAGDDMPKNRKPLSDMEKQYLKQWIDNGAQWPVKTLHPSIYGKNRGEDVVWLQRLTVPEYIETVRSTVGVDIADDARKILPADIRADGFHNTAYNLTVDLEHVKAYAKLAELIVKKMDAEKFASKYSSDGKFTDDNMHNLIAGMGGWLLRGPLDEKEIQSFAKIPQAIRKEGGNYREAVSFLIEAMLQSPRFLYRMERQTGDGKVRPVGQYELASRMSYILWGGPPDKELYRAAAAGELSQLANAEAQVKRMLKDSRAVQRSRQFAAEWLNLDRLANLRPNKKHFPKWNAKLADDMREETLRFYEEVTWTKKRPLTDLLNAQFTYLTPELAKHYGVQAIGNGWQRYDTSKISGRGGLLTQGSVLTVGGDEASMVARGLFILTDLLDDEVGDPPPCVDTTPVPTKEGLSQRGVALTRLANSSCVGCHSRFEPLAFGLEKFDGLGSYHEVDEHGNKLREDGEILFPGSEKPQPYKTSAQLMNLLAESDRVRECLTKKVTQFALGRPLVSSDEKTLAKIYQATRGQNATYERIITAVVLSDLVRLTRTETP